MENLTTIDQSPAVIYVTGLTRGGVTLIGGVWKLWEQEGFPLEMSHLICGSNGWAVDWLEAMADASCTNNGPALLKHIELFLPVDAMTAIKLGFMRILNDGKTCGRIVAEKQAGGLAVSSFIHATKH